MLASAWNLVVQGLKELERIGLVERNVRDQLRQSERMRIIYLVVFKMVENIIAIDQQQLRYIAQFTGENTHFPIGSLIHIRFRRALWTLFQDCQI